MIVEWQEQLRPGVALREIVQQATAALIAMDAERLEELARCCRDLNRDLETAGSLPQLTDALRDCRGDLQLLRRVLYETRANLAVLTRLHTIRIAESSPVPDQLLPRSSESVLHPAALPDWREEGAAYGDN